jgi:hypothetical protein
LGDVITGEALFAAAVGEEEGIFTKLGGYYLVNLPMIVRWLMGTAKDALEEKSMPARELAFDGGGFDFSPQRESTLRKTILDLQAPIREYLGGLQRIAQPTDKT